MEFGKAWEWSSWPFMGKDSDEEEAAGDNQFVDLRGGYRVEDEAAIEILRVLG